MEPSIINGISQPLVNQPPKRYHHDHRGLRLLRQPCKPAILPNQMCTYNYYRWDHPCCRHFLGLGFRRKVAECEWKDDDPDRCLAETRYGIESHRILMPNGRIVNMCSFCWDNWMRQLEKDGRLPTRHIPRWFGLDRTHLS